MDMGTANIVLDIVLIAASIWMLFAARGIGGLVGQSLNLIIAGAIVLGFAHLIATWLPKLVTLGPDPASATALNNLIHRLIVLGGFVLVTLGFQQVRQLTK
jgi:hypothetical protein